jgi:very-short-patch-repair endonuclease
MPKVTSSLFSYPDGMDGSNQDKVIPLCSELPSGVIAHQYVDDYKRNRARELRRNSTFAEKLLWAQLRNRQVGGFKFRRQQAIEGFVADFYCDEAKLVIELDGSIHNLESKKQKDQHKENVFIARGLFVLRFKNEQVVNRIKNVTSEIISIINKRLGK